MAKCAEGRQEAAVSKCVKDFFLKWPKSSIHAWLIPILSSFCHQKICWLRKWASKLKSLFFRGSFSRLTFPVRRGPCLLDSVSAIALDSVLALDFSVKSRSSRRRYHIFDELRYEFFENWQKWTKLNGKKWWYKLLWGKQSQKNTLYYEFWLFYNYTSWYEHSSYYELESKYQKINCSITIPHGMSIAHTMSLNQNIKKIIKELVAKKSLS